MNVSQKNHQENNPWLTPLRGRLLLLIFLSVIAGSVDAIGFLGLGGLFIAHITGNLVIVAAHFLTGGFSQVGPLLAVPVFMVVLGLTTLASNKIEAAGLSTLRSLLVLETALLAGFLGLAIAQGPFPDADTPVAVVVGVLGVAAMAVQNALGKLAIKQTPSTAAMTTNITQLTVDIVTIIRGATVPEAENEVRRRAGTTLVCVVGFIVGCAAGAVLEAKFGFRSLILPFVLSVVSSVLGWIE